MSQKFGGGNALSPFFGGSLYTFGPVMVRDPRVNGPEGNHYFKHFAAHPDLEKVSPDEKRWQTEYPEDYAASQAKQIESAQAAQKERAEKERKEREALWGQTMQKPLMQISSQQQPSITLSSVTNPLKFQAQTSIPTGPTFHPPSLAKKPELSLCPSAPVGASALMNDPFLALFQASRMDMKQ